MSDDSKSHLRKILHKEFMMSDRAKQALNRSVARLTSALTYDRGTLYSAQQAAEILQIHPDAIANLLITRDLFAMISTHDQHLGKDPGIPSWLIHHGKPLPGIPLVMDRLAANGNDHHLRAICFFAESNGLLGGKTPVECLRDGLVDEVVFAAGEWDIGQGR